MKSGAQAASSLEEAVRRGLRAEAERAARERLSEGEAPMDLVEKRLLPALDPGRRWRLRQRTPCSCPSCSWSAGRAAAGRLCPGAAGLGEKRAPACAGKGGLLLATVEGADIHDIGKNIVKVLLESYGFEVLVIWAKT